MLKKISATLLLVILITTSMVNANTPVPEIKSRSGILICKETGQIIYEKDAYTRRPMASTTKMMTCILAIENLDLKQKVTVGNIPYMYNATLMDLKKGEVVTVEELLYGLMLISANDAAMVLGQTLAGIDSNNLNIEKEFWDAELEYAKIMNAKAEELGLKDTHFVNSMGFDDKNHYSTARDLAFLGKYCMENPTFGKIVATRKYQVPKTNKSKVRKFPNTNLLISGQKITVKVNGKERPTAYKGAYGLKTGFTPRAGNCLVGGAKLNMEFSTIAATLDVEYPLTRYADQIELFDYASSSLNKNIIF
ncbi:MAG: D-alanyl-D-alanine carboxypeptidase family protein, partial [Anaerovoracaceae bacterium]